MKHYNPVWDNSFSADQELSPPCSSLQDILSSKTLLSKVAYPIVYPSPLFILGDKERLRGLGWLGELEKLAFQTQLPLN